MSIVGTVALTKFWELCKGTFVKKGDSISRSGALVNATSRKDFNLLIDDDVTRVRNMAYTHFAMDNPTAPTSENKNYNVITLSGSDGFAISQLALGTSDQEVYYRKAAWNRDSRNWTPWRRLVYADECPTLTEVPLKFAQDAEGNWGYITPGADTVIPFSDKRDGGDRVRVVEADFVSDIVPIKMVGAEAVFREINYAIKEGYEQINGQD